MGIHSKVAGVTRTNDDGTDRQTLVRMLKPGDLLQLVREPENPHGSTAIKVCNKEGLQIGYVKSELSQELSPKIDRGIKFEAFVLSITGGGEDRSYGCNYYIQKKGERDFGELLAEDKPFEEQPADTVSTELPKKKTGCLGCLGKLFLAFIIVFFVLFIISLFIGG